MNAIQFSSFIDEKNEVQKKGVACLLSLKASSNLIFLC